MSIKPDQTALEPARLETKKYSFIADGTLPVLDVELKSGKDGSETEKVTFELYNPLSGEVFEAKYDKGRIEVDRDGSITYFSAKRESVNFSLFIGHNLLITASRNGDVLIKTPSKILKIEQDIRSIAKGSSREVVSDSIRLKLG
jgi:hypothetical protein